MTQSLFPANAQAVIYKPARSTMMSAPKRKEEWKLRFGRRTPLQIEPLMGWTEDDDPLAQMELSFPSAEAAIAYARRQGLQYIVVGSPSDDPRGRLVANKGAVVRQHTGDTDPRRRKLEWLERAATESHGVERFHRRAHQPATTRCAHQSRERGWRTSACRCLIGRALARSLSPGDALLAPISAAGMRSQTKVGPFGHPREVYLMSTASSANASFAIVLLLLMAALGALLVVWDESHQCALVEKPFDQRIPRRSKAAGPR
jgi:NADH dehydrogenase ubiquinone Fe-S protein 4